MYDIFEDYMGVQYREGVEAYQSGKSRFNNPYHFASEMGKAWKAGFDKAHEANK